MDLSNFVVVNKVPKKGEYYLTLTPSHKIVRLNSECKRFLDKINAKHVALLISKDNTQLAAVASDRGPCVEVGKMQFSSAGLMKLLKEKFHVAPDEGLRFTGKVEDDILLFDLENPMRY